MKKSLKTIAVSSCAAVAASCLMLLSACGDTVENVYQTGSDVVSSVEDLPKCSDKNEGELAWVKGEPSVRICSDGEWFATISKDGDADFSCKTEELKDGSGLKIICNGDSIGVVLNGSDGKQGKAGKDGASGSGCTVVDKSDTAVTLACGDSTMVIELGSGAGSEVLELDSEKVAVSMDSLAGYSQKGPFLKGSTVYLYELSDGRTLKQTNGNFTSIITRDDGRYKFTARDLASQYAMIVVEGYYRNEVTGNPSNAAIRLRALTDMRKRSSANVNLLTHLEFDRVYYLVTREGMTVKKAKAQAQKEILNAFLIDTTGFNASAEDLDVFGQTDADAALLAISILLQNEGNETDLSVLLTEIAADIETDGLWNGTESDSIRANIADWAAGVDTVGKAALFRKHVDDWHLSDSEAPLFERYLRMFWSNNWGLGVCGHDSARVGTVRHAANSRVYHAKDYLDTSNTKVRFICVDADSARWRVATDIEKDTTGLGEKFKDGDIKFGQINSNVIYVFENKKWRNGSRLDSIVNLGCVHARKDTVAMGSDGIWYKCKTDTTIRVRDSEWASAWREAESIEKDTASWGHDFEEGDVRNGRINTSLTYVYQDGNWRLGTELDSLLAKAGGKGCVLDNDTSTVKYDSMYYVCRAQSSGNVPRKWVTAPTIYNDTYEARSGCNASGKYADGTILTGRLYSKNKYVCDAGEFRLADKMEIAGNKGCVSYIRGIEALLEYSYYKCETDGWKFNFNHLNTGTFRDTRGSGRIYKTIGIKSQMWMAENLDYNVTGSYCYKGSADSCAKYGRLYTWATAMGSTESSCGVGKTCYSYGKPGICPTGWHLPSIDEWVELYNNTEETPVSLAVPKSGYSDEWRNADNRYGFTMLYAGWYFSTYAEGPIYWYAGYGDQAFWSSDEYYNSAKDSAEGWRMKGTSPVKSYSAQFSRNDRLPVRCIKDK